MQNGSMGRTVAVQMDEASIKSAYRRWAPVYDNTFGRFTTEGRRHAVEIINQRHGRVLEVGVGTGLGLDISYRIIKNRLAKIAADNPRILKDPAPDVLFEDFADSTLNLALRCYLPNMDNRLRARTELCEAIDESFKQEGIEFAHRNVTVYMPPEKGSEAAAQTAGEAQQEDAESDSNVARQAAAPAALALIQAEAEETAKQKPEK